MVSMNKLATADRVAVIAALVEGCSIRSTVRMTGVAKNTIAKLLADIGEACQTYHDSHVTGLKCKRIQCDEIWSFCYAKEKNVPEKMQGAFGVGDVWTWTAIDPDTKLMAQWYVGDRTTACATEFMDELGSRLTCRIQITTDGHHSYAAAIRNALCAHVETDYAKYIKKYADVGTPAGRYSPGECTGVEVKVMWGDPDPKHISTSHVERQNLTMRMQMRRFTRLTNAFSKKVQNHMHAVALHFMHYNFCRVHQTLRVTPAMQAGLADHVWELEELVALLG
jgi:IS1 family transposase